MVRKKIKKVRAKTKRMKIKKTFRNKAKITQRKGGKRVVVAVSGGFDPIHVGHIRMLEEAKKLGTELVVILNNDNWLKSKKGYVFMPQEERRELLLSIRTVDRVVLSEHKPADEDRSVCRDLLRIKPNVFANGGDRTQDNIPEVAVCNEMNCSLVFGVGRGGKVQSSSWLLEKFRNGN
jgi:cytidyltransferase-like protein